MVEHVAIAPVEALIIELGPHLADDPHSPRARRHSDIGPTPMRLSISAGKIPGPLPTGAKNQVPPLHDRLLVFAQREERPPTVRERR